MDQTFTNAPPDEAHKLKQEFADAFVKIGPREGNTVVQCIVLPHVDFENKETLEIAARWLCAVTSRGNIQRERNRLGQCTI